MQNQTEELWLTDSVPNAEGTGLFLVRSDPASNFGGSFVGPPISSENHGLLQKALIENLTYSKCVNRGEKPHVVAFKWVPNTLASYSVVFAAAQSCTPTRCIRRCATYGCLCESGVCK